MANGIARCETDFANRPGVGYLIAFREVRAAPSGTLRAVNTDGAR